MKGLVRKTISIVLVITTLLTLVIPASAARPKANQFLSELQMAQASTADEAKTMLITAGYTVIDKDLNPDGEVSVYLGYKTSTNVEDAITDIAVMNMNGGYSITDYNRILEDTKTEYKAMTANYRIVAKEFAENYMAGDRDAKLAYRQLNYYYIEKNGHKTYMGDFMLNFPATDDEFVDILLKGNLFVLNNIRALLAMGVGQPDVSIEERVTEITHDETVYANEGYQTLAKALFESLMNAKVRIDETNKAIQEVESDEASTKEEKLEIIEILVSSIQNTVAFRSLIESYPYGDTTYGEYLQSKNYITDYSVFYPIIEALTPAQRILVEYGQLAEIVIYDTIRKSDEDIESKLKEVEEEFGEISVYHGTDLEAFNGSFAVTDDAMRVEAATGQSWMDAQDGGAQNDKLMVSILVGLGGVLTTTISALFLKETISYYIAITPAYAETLEIVNNLSGTIESAKKAVEMLSQQIGYNGLATDPVMRGVQRQLHSAIDNYVKFNDKLMATPMHAVDRSIWPIVGSSIGVIIGLVMIGYSITNIVKIANSYKVEYTDIPINMIDCVDTENGNRYVRYRVVNSLYEEDDTIKTRPGDTNGYDGQQWNAIYYTKSYEAGKCLLSNVDFPQNEKDFGKYTPVHEFGKVDVCYNINKYTKRNSLTSSTTDITQEVFLAFQNSNAKKAAETEVPTIVGSVFNYGVAAISSIAGFGLGMGVMAIIKSKKKKVEAEVPAN